MTDITEANKPTNPSLWSKAKSMARQKFDVYPSAYANGWAAKWYKSKGGGWKTANEEINNENCWDGYKQVGMKKKGSKMVPNCVKESTTYKVVKQVIHENLYTCCDNCDCELSEASSPAWQRKEGKNPEGGLNKKGVASYRAANPGSKLQTAVTTKPSKLKKGSKAANRRKSFCSRMKGMKAKLTSAETARDPDSRINKSLRKWNC
jgi:hypothetical protein